MYNEIKKMNLLSENIQQTNPEENKNLNLTGASGILPDSLIKKLLARKKIQSLDEITDQQIQPASLDLRLGKKAYRIRASFIPSENKKVLECATDLIDHEFSIEDGDYDKIVWKDERTIPTKAQIETKITELEAEEPVRILRLHRDRLLQETDWVSARSVDSGTPVSQEWVAYRQALRDLPVTAEPQLDENGNLTNVTWPVKPV